MEKAKNQDSFEDDMIPEEFSNMSDGDNIDEFIEETVDDGENKIKSTGTQKSCICMWFIKSNPKVRNNLLIHGYVHILSTFFLG